MGEFCREMNCAVIFERQTCNIDAERAKLLGARLAMFNEPDAGDKLKISEVKLLSGGDGIPAKALYKDPITIQPQHLCILIANFLPTLSEINPAIIERMICINFPVVFVDLAYGEPPTMYRRQRDNGLKDRLKDGRAAFVKWLVDGAVAWYCNKDLKRNAPEKVKAFTKEYLTEQDTVQTFLDQYCETGNGFKVSGQDLWGTYNLYYDQMKASDFYCRMKTKGYIKKKIRTTVSSYQGFDGIRLISSDH